MPAASARPSLTLSVQCARAVVTDWSTIDRYVDDAAHNYQIKARVTVKTSSDASSPQVSFEQLRIMVQA